jgi:Lrp/AsnC family leucine-responsive transcriptional regulator
MDSKDREIINALLRNGRISNQELAEQVHLSPSPCLRRVRQLEESGVIRGQPRAAGALVPPSASCQLSLRAFSRLSLFESQPPNLS